MSGAPPLTPLQKATRHVLAVYTAACRTLNAAERDVLRDILAARLAADYLAEQGGILGDGEAA
jgi:hypothetical protein